MGSAAPTNVDSGPQMGSAAGRTGEGLRPRGSPSRGPVAPPRYANFRGQVSPPVTGAVSAAMPSQRCICTETPGSNRSIGVPVQLVGSSAAPFWDVDKLSSVVSRSAAPKCFPTHPGAADQPERLPWSLHHSHQARLDQPAALCGQPRRSAHHCGCSTPTAASRAGFGSLRGRGG